MAGGAAVAFALWRYGIGLPDYSQLANYEPAITTRVHAGDGRLITEFAREKRLYVPYETIPKLVINAFVSAEDQNFFVHRGVDPIGIMRAAIVNLQHAGDDRRLVGASTITQQVAKNFFLSGEVSYQRKIKEAILAFRIERTFSKERLLELISERNLSRQYRLWRRGGGAELFRQAAGRSHAGGSRLSGGVAEGAK